MLPFHDISLEDLSDDGLSLVRWSFYLHREKGLVVDTYAELSRPSKRHKWQTQRSWSRLGQSYKWVGISSSKEVPLTEDIVRRARQRFLDLVTDYVTTIPIGIQDD